MSVALWFNPALPNDHINITAMETNFRKLGGLHLYKRRIQQVCQPPSNLSLAHTLCV